MSASCFAVSSQDAIVYVVDDDSRIRESLSELLSTYDLQAVTFGSATEYMAYAKPDRPACLILDVELPDINGLDFQSQGLKENQPGIVFITGHGDIPTSVRAIKAGAVDFLTKPFREEDLMRAIQAALEGDREARRKRVELQELRQRLATLTPRERELFSIDRERSLEQAGRGRARHHRSHGPGSSRQDHEEDGGGFARRPREDSRGARDTDHPYSPSAKIIAAGQPV